MKLYLIRYKDRVTGRLHTEVETAMNRVEKRLVELLQLPIWEGMAGQVSPSQPMLHVVDIPTPATQATIKALIEGRVLEFRVDKDGNPDPWPSGPRRAPADMFTQASTTTSSTGTISTSPSEGSKVLRVPDPEPEHEPEPEESEPVAEAEPEPSEDEEEEEEEREFEDIF